MFQSNKVLITGATSGLGKALAQVYMKTAKELYLCDIDETGLAEFVKTIQSVSDSNVHSYKLDVSDTSKLIEFVDKINSIDLLINIVGVRFQGTIKDTILDQYAKNLYISVYSHLILISELFKKADPPKKIINILSITAMRGRNLRGLHSSAKAVLWNSTRSLGTVYDKNYQIIEGSPSFTSSTILFKHSIVTYSENKTDFSVVENLTKKRKFQNKFGFLRTSNVSALSAAIYIRKTEIKGKEILFIPPVRARLFAILELFSTKFLLKVSNR
jgi:NAD(P)-dependent dehydrogenase (short-subunit alcohol dehydrogenase family)